jgi:hypothetical protein
MSRASCDTPSYRHQLNFFRPSGTIQSLTIDEQDDLLEEPRPKKNNLIYWFLLMQLQEEVGVPIPIPPRTKQKVSCLLFLLTHS